MTAPAPPRELGNVVWFRDAKGFGFIRPAAPGPDRFVHFREIRQEGYRTLEEGELVEFTPSDGERGPCALNVVRQGDLPAEGAEPESRLMQRVRVALLRRRDARRAGRTGEVEHNDRVLDSLADALAAARGTDQ